MELRNQPSLDQALNAIQKGAIIQKVNEDLKKNIIELGKEGALLKTRLREITLGVEREADLVIKDYSKVGMKKSKEALKSFTFEDLFSKEELLSALAYENEVLTEPVKGWRTLSRTSLPEADVALLIKETGSLGAAIHSGIMMHQEIFGSEKAQLFREEISKIKISM
jgi:diadenylate cyclase